MSYPEIKIVWTQAKKDKVCKRLEEWIIKHFAVAGEIICQSDDCLISAPDMLADLVDDVIKPKVLE